MCSDCREKKRYTAIKKYQEVNRDKINIQNKTWQNEHRGECSSRNADQYAFRKARESNPNLPIMITCKVCNIDIEVPSRRTKMCPKCSKDLQLRRAREYKKANSEKVALNTAIWKAEHKDEVTTYNKQYEIERKNTDFEFKVLKLIRARFAIYYKGSRNAKDIISCTPPDLVEWFRSNFTEEMTWQNHGKLWHIDHVIPCEHFDLTNEDEHLLCFHWQNMRPLLAKRNIGRKVSLQDFMQHEILIRSYSQIAKDDYNFGKLATKRCGEILSWP